MYPLADLRAAAGGVWGGDLRALGIRVVGALVRILAGDVAGRHGHRERRHGMHCRLLLFTLSVRLMRSENAASRQDCYLHGRKITGDLSLRERERPSKAPKKKQY